MLVFSPSPLLEADVCVLTGTASPDVVPVDMYRRLTEDIRANDTPVVADLSGDQLTARSREAWTSRR